MKYWLCRKSWLGVLVAAHLTACGTYVPDIQEFWGTPEDASIKVNKIAGQVVCELHRAVQQVYQDNLTNYPIYEPSPGHSPPKHHNLDWFDKWSAQVNLKLNIIEDTDLTPGATLNTVYPGYVTGFPGKPAVSTGQSYATGFGATLTDTATRTDQLNMFFSVKELKADGKSALNLSCVPPPTNADLFIQSDLKLYDWLSAALLPEYSDIIDIGANTSPQNTIIHDIKFEIVTDATANASWKLVHISANTSPNLLAVGRDRTQELIITFAPAGSSSKSLAPAAQGSLDAIETGSSVGQNIRGR
jgi:hypothetical protein